MEQLLYEDLSLHCDFDLEDRNPTFCMTFRVMLMRHQAKFHEERWSGSEDNYRLDKYSLRIGTLTVTVTLKTAIQNGNIAQRLVMMHH